MLTEIIILCLPLLPLEPTGAMEAYGRLGHHAVGVRAMLLVDESRRDEYAGGARTLVTDVWYPAEAQEERRAPTTFEDFFRGHRDAAAGFVEHFGGTLEDVNRRFRTVAVRDAPRAPGRFPLLVFSHGNGGVRHQNVFQLDHLASHGYIVATADHTGNAGVTPFPDRPLPYDRKVRTRSFADRPLDVSFLITRLIEESERRGGWLEGAIDGEKVGVLGHSFGGYTACGAAESDRRVRAILPMTVAVGQAGNLPVFVMLGARDRTIGLAGNLLSTAYYEASTGPKHLLTLRRGGHFSFSDMDRINPRFGDGIGRDSRTGEPFLSCGEAKRWINIYSLAFFDFYLKGLEEAGRVLCREPEGGEVSLRSENVPRRGGDGGQPPEEAGRPPLSGSGSAGGR
ncbi:MAG: hypothetical protein JXA90_12295 [Planctomycetes bacterium]|nr:hypothetical protein [Planctomycetota bacterium]